jgi:hypothetical protein
MLEASRPFLYEEPVDPMNVECTKLDFGHSGGMAERVSEALAERGTEFHRLGPAPR